MNKYVQLFNSPFETGIRSLTILTESFPLQYDLNQLVEYDYLIVHTADVGGPPSLHPPLPLRTGELLIRRKIIEEGLYLMQSKGLILKEMLEEGIFYKASEDACVFLDSLVSQYIMSLRSRAEWLVTDFLSLPATTKQEIKKDVFRNWTCEFIPLMSIGRLER